MVKKYTVKVFFSKKSNYRLKGFLRSKFLFGDTIVQSSSRLILTLRFVLRFVLFLKKIVRRRVRGVRRFWFSPSSYRRVSLKSKGARMGKGKGKNNIPFREVFPFTNLLEFKNVRRGRVYYFIKVLNSRLPNYLFVKLPTPYTSYPLLLNK